MPNFPRMKCITHFKGPFPALAGNADLGSSALDVVSGFALGLSMTMALFMTRL